VFDVVSSPKILTFLWWFLHWWWSMNELLMIELRGSKA
jgi:hypothetical protein